MDDRPEKRALALRNIKNMHPLINIIKGSLKEGRNILELGCGDGKLINDIVKTDIKLGKVVAVDYFNEPKALDTRIKFIKKDLEKFDIDDNDHFDFVIMNHVLEHIKNPLRLIEVVKSGLNKYGKILIVVPNRYGFGNEARVYLPEHGKHYFLWDKESLQYSLERLGFVCRFYNLYTAGSHNLILKYLPMFFRIQNPNLICLAMLDLPNE